MNLCKRALILLLLACSSNHVYAQNMSINRNGAKPHPSAMLDVTSSDKGVLIPRTDTATINASGIALAEGLLIYQTIDSNFYYYNGVKWRAIDSPDSDDQKVDAFAFSSGTLSLSLEGDGEPTKTVNLSSINTDDQTIDAFSFSSGTLSLSLQDDGEPTKTLNLSSINTDNQTIDAFTFSSGILSLSLEDDGEPSKTLNLSSINTDNQTIDAFGFSSGILSISLEDDGQAARTVNLSSINTDNQKIDAFTFSSGILSLSLEDDGESTKTVNLSSINTDNQTIDALGFSSGILSISLEDDGQSARTVNLSSINTDNQKIDAFGLSGSNLSLSLEDDGESTKTVNLSSINTDNQTIDAFSLSGSTLSLSLEDDGQATKTVDMNSLLPVGSIVMYAGSSAPTNWLICNGSTFSSSTYPALSALLGSTTLPNFSGRFPLGVGNSGAPGSTNHNLGTVGGEEKHTLTTNEIPSHSHNSGSLKVEALVLSQTNDGTGNQDARDGGGKKLYEYNDITGSTSSEGGGQSHNTMPPFRTVNFIIKAR